jgi:Divergent InlB B-repeat domain
MLSMVIFTHKAYSAQETLAWDPITDPSVTGYKLYYGPTSGNYTQSIDVGNVTTCIVSNLTSGSTYYFAATVHDAIGNESDFSNEVSKTIPGLYSITTSSDSNGTIIPSGNPPVSQASNGSSVMKLVTVSQGSSQSFSITPNAGYHVADVKADGTSLGVVGAYTFNNVTADHSLNATFAISGYSITSSAENGGSVSPAGTTTVNSGAGQTFTITPSTGYQIAGVVVDGVSAGAVSTYTFTNVTANHTISVTFSVKTYTISATTGTSGSVSPAGISAVNYGGSQMFSITPATGYHVAGVKVDGSSVSAVASYTFSNVTANHTIAATFAINTYTVSASAGTGGSISPSGISTVNYGGSKTFRISPNRGYKIKSVSVDGVSIGAVSTYTFSNVKANHTIVITYVKNT